MATDEPTADGSTRREYVAGAGALLGTGLLAGCAGYTPSGDGDAGDGSYTASVSPVGEVSFDQVPEDVFTVFTQYADMAVALGHGDAINAVYVPEMSGTTMNHYYEHLDGVAFEWDGLVDPLSDGFGKEQLYSLDSDVHLTDPAWAASQNNWDRSDTVEIAGTVAPWFGNFYSGTRATPPGDWGSDYEYYTLWELFGHVADVFDERERYEALAEVHSNLVTSIQAELPPPEERPTAVRATLAADGSSFYTYHLNEPGYWLADTRPLGANDAFADADWDGLWGTVGYETMLEADPDVFLHLWGLTPNYSMAETRSKLEAHDAGSRLTAVENDRVYPAGMRYHGPIMNLFQIEMGAKQLYPERFGEWPAYEDGEHYPEIPAEERLFDRETVASIVRGEV
ncbi:ABC transporter substrate-binding protein [Salinarchaeum chitinilyticum]